MKGKNKLVPRLLGITKECVMRVDEKTKEVIQEWSLTNIKRWAASPKSFTLVCVGIPMERVWGYIYRSFPPSLGRDELNRAAEQVFLSWEVRLDWIEKLSEGCLNGPGNGWIHSLYSTEA